MRALAAFALVAVCSGAAACGADRGADEGQASADTAAADSDVAEVTCAAYAEQGLRVDARSREAYRAALGEPDSVASETVANRHVPGVTDTIFRWHYPGLTTQIWKPGTEGGTDLLDRVEVRSDDHLAWPELGIGTRAERIVQAFGPPMERSEQRIEYACGSGMGAETVVAFLLEGGRVSEVHFDMYVD